jgi:hypothetical protein
VTVRRSLRVEFPRSVDERSRSVGGALSGNRWYTNVREEAGEYRFRYRPWAWPLILSTRVRIEIRSTGRGSEVTIRTSSQPFIFGDVLGEYKRLLNQLAREIGSA